MKLPSVLNIASMSDKSIVFWSQSDVVRINQRF